MTTGPGRPRATSSETIAEAACELFLERGYDRTSVVDIAQRAGVSRSSFFNYFDSKAAILWAGLDARIDRAAEVLSAPAGAASDDIRRALEGIGVAFTPDALALAHAQREAMGLDEELARESALRAARIARAVTLRLRADGMPDITASVAGAAHGGAVLAAVAAWAAAGAGSAALPAILTQALDAAAATLRC
jgi:AcrR family transcriptional regulator